MVSSSPIEISYRKLEKEKKHPTVSLTTVNVQLVVFVVPEARIFR